MSELRDTSKELVHVSWVDSGGVDGAVWHFKDEYDLKLHECESVGFLVENTKQHIIIAQSQNPDQWGRLFVIPKGAITKVVKL